MDLEYYSRIEYVPVMLVEVLFFKNNMQLPNQKQQNNVIILHKEAA